MNHLIFSEGMPYPSRDRSASCNDGAFFDERRAARAVAAFEHYFKHSKGEFAGRAFILDPWQRRLTEDIWGWRRESDGARLYRTVFVGLPRKEGKTTYAAGIANALLLFDGEPRAEIYSIAGNRNQARIVFEEANAMIAQSPALARECELLKSAIYCPNLRGRFMPLAAKASNQHGLNPHGIVGDEVHAWGSREQYDVMRTALGARRQPLELYITTAGYDLNSLCWELWEHALAVRDGIKHDPSFLPVIFAADPNSDWTSPETWARANPGIHRPGRLEYLQRECERAKAIPAQENAFKQLYLNIWTEQAERWLPMAKWNEASSNASPFMEATLRGRPCWLGLDLAWSRDLTALALVFPPNGVDPNWYAILRFFIPEEGLRIRAMKERTEYDVWTRQGFLKATPGDVTDFGAIKREVLTLCELFNVQEIAFDRMFAGSLINDLTDEGAKCVGVGQGFVSMALPCAELERAVLAGQFRHNANPVLRWNASNVVVMRDERGNMKPDHKKARERIDGIQAILTAMARAISPEQAAPSPYEKRAPLILG